MTGRKGGKASFEDRCAEIKRKRRSREKKRAMKAKASKLPPGPDPPPIAEAGRAVVKMDRAAAVKVVELVEGDPHRECGLLFIGNICTDSITGATVAFVDDVYTDGEYGGAAEYTFSPGMQIGCLSHIERMYGGTKHVVGTVHSHGRFNAFFSSVDRTMMESRISDEVHMVISPSHNEYVLTFKDRKYEYHEADLVMKGITDVFRYVRRRD